jgi:hypothetical protein
MQRPMWQRAQHCGFQHHGHRVAGRDAIQEAPVQNVRRAQSEGVQTPTQGTRTSATAVHELRARRASCVRSRPPDGRVQGLALQELQHGPRIVGRRHPGPPPHARLPRAFIRREFWVALRRKRAVSLASPPWRLRRRSFCWLERIRSLASASITGRSGKRCSKHFRTSDKGK